MNILHLAAAGSLAALLATGCASAPAPATATPYPAAGASALDPVGTYNFSSQAGGESFAGVIRIARADTSGYTGSVSTPLTGDLPVRSVAVEGERVRIIAAGQMGDVVVDLALGGTSFTGTWAYGRSRGFLTGAFAPAAGAPPRESLPAAGEEGVAYVGDYQLTDVALQIRVFRQDDHLAAQATGQRAFPLLYRGEHRFESPSGIGIVLEFAVVDGRATGLTLRQHGRAYTASRLP